MCKGSYAKKYVDKTVRIKLGLTDSDIVSLDVAIRFRLSNDFNNVSLVKPWVRGVIEIYTKMKKKNGKMAWKFETLVEALKNNSVSFVTKLLEISDDYFNELFSKKYIYAAIVLLKREEFLGKIFYNGLQEETKKLFSALICAKNCNNLEKLLVFAQKKVLVLLQELLIIVQAMKTSSELWIVC